MHESFLTGFSIYSSRLRRIVMMEREFIYRTEEPLLSDWTGGEKHF